MTFSLNRLLQRHRAEACLALAIGLSLLLLWLVAGPPLVAYGKNRDTLLTLQDRLARYQAVGARRDATMAALKSVDDSQSALDAYLLPHGAESVLQADLQALVQEIVTRYGGQIVSTQAIHDRDDSDRLKVRLHFKASMDDLVSTLYALEFGKPALVIREFNVQAGRAPARQAGARPALLDVRLVAQAFADSSVPE